MSGLYAIVSLMSFLINFLFFIFMLPRLKKKSGLINYLIVVFLVTVWQFSEFLNRLVASPRLAIITGHINNSIAVFLAIFYFFFISSLINNKPTKRAKIFSIAVGIILVLLINLTQLIITTHTKLYPWGFMVEVGKLNFLFSIFLVGFFYYSLSLILVKYKKETKKPQKRYWMIILVSSFLAISLGMFTDGFSRLINYEILPLGGVASTVLVGLMVYAIKYSPNRSLRFKNTTVYQRLLFMMFVFSVVVILIFSFSFYAYSSKHISSHLTIPQHLSDSSRASVSYLVQNKSFDTPYNLDKAIEGRLVKLKLKLVFFGFLFLMLMLLGVYMIIKIIEKPFDDLKYFLSEVARGNLDIKFDLEHTSISNDEFGDILNTFKTMVENIREYRARLLESKKKKTKELEDMLKNKTKESMKAIKELNDTKLAIFNMMEDVLEANEELKELDEAKSNFLNIVSHELKTPLTAMQAHLDIIEDRSENLTDQQLLSLNAVRRNGAQLKMLIENILEISRIESNKFELNLTNFNLNEILDEILDNLKILAKKKSIKLVGKYNKLPTIFADEARFREIMNNLISNAIKFTEKGSVRVSVKKEKNYIRVSIKDTGIGIPKEKMSQLFTKFYQVDATLGRRYGGTGLGLSITKQLIELQGGKIMVESVEGKGSEFIFTLPLRVKK